MGGLRVYVVKRLLLFILVIFGVTVVAFTVSHVVPTDPIYTLYGQAADFLTASELVRIRGELGLDKPLHEQYVSYLQDLIKGNLGRSLHTRRPVIVDLAARWPATIELSIVAMVFALAIGIPVGVYSAIRRNTLPDNIARIGSLMGVATPTFFLALIILLVFYYNLGWIGIGRLTEGLQIPRVTSFYLVDSLVGGRIDIFADVLWHTVPPALVLGYTVSATINRLTRSSMLEVLGQDYIRTARAKGLPQRIVYYKHALKNAMIPTVTVAGLALGGLLTGTVLTETIFVWPGLGMYAVEAALHTDFPAIMGVSIFFALIFSSVNLIVDLLYGVLDPRIRYG